MTARRERLLWDAVAAGYEVTGHRGEIVQIVKWDGRARKKRRPLRGITLYIDGTAFDVMVDLSVARSFRSYADMRSVLGLKPEGV